MKLSTTAVYCAAFVVLLISTECQALTVFNVRDFGAKGDGHTKDTDAIRKATEAVAEAGGGVLLFEGGSFLTAPFNLSSGTVMMVQENARILASQDLDDYPLIAPLPSYGTGRENKPGFTARYHPIVYAVGVSDVTITGGGILDGQGQPWYEWHKQGVLNCTRPHLLEIQHGTNIAISNITFTNSPFWTVHPVYCDGVRITDVTIRNPPGVVNTDGIDPDSSRNVYIARADIVCGDDNIAMKSGWDAAGIVYGQPTADVLIEDCRFGPGNGVAVGSETGGGVHNVTVRNVRMLLAGHGVYLKSGRGRGGDISNITFDGMTLDGVGSGITLSLYYTHEPPGNATTTPRLHDVSVRNVRGAAAQAGTLDCLPESPCTGIALQDIDITALRGFVSCQYAHGSAQDVKPDVSGCLQA